MTKAGRQVLADAMKRYRLLEAAHLLRVREPKSSGA